MTDYTQYDPFREREECRFEPEEVMYYVKCWECGSWNKVVNFMKTDEKFEDEGYIYERKCHSCPEPIPVSEEALDIMEQTKTKVMADKSRIRI